MVSVIIPVYNTERYLGRCIASILDSTYQEFEVILVNDGSTDRSLQVCRRYCGKDHRIKLIDQKHKGVSEARNRGICESRGEWLIFVDSDDMVSRDFLEIVAQDRFRGQDLLLFDFAGLREEKRRQERMADFRSVCCDREAVYYGKDSMAGIIENMLCVRQLKRDGNVNLYSSCAKAYKASGVKRYGLQFPADITIGEDRIFNVEYLLEAKACAYIPKTVYYTGRRRESLTHRYHGDYLKQDIRFRKRLKSLLQKKRVYDQVEGAYYENALCGMADVLIRGIFHPDSKKTRYENRKLCRKMRENEIYRQAMKYNIRSGRMARKLLLFFVYLRCYGIVELFSRVSYVALEGKGV